MSIDGFKPNVPFLYPLKTSENQKFSDVFRGYKNKTLDSNGLNYFNHLALQNTVQYSRRIQNPFNM